MLNRRGRAMKGKVFALLFFCLFGIRGWPQEQGSVVRQEYATSGGTFSFQLNAGRGAQDALQPMDASVSSGQYGGLSSRGASSSITAGPFGGASSLGVADSLNLSARELVAELSGFQSDQIALGSRRALDNPDVGVIVLHRTVVPDSGTVSLKTLAAPKKAAKAFEQAGKELRKKEINFPKVMTELEKAVEIYPDFAEAWQVLGEVRLELQAREAARGAFEWALADSSLGNLKEAETSALRVQGSGEADKYLVTHYILGWIQAKRGNFELAAGEYRRFMEIEPTASVRKELLDQLGQWESLGLIDSVNSSDSKE